MKFEIEQIGTIHSPYKTKKECPIQGVVEPDGIGLIEIFSKYIEALDTIETFSHIFIIYMFDRANEMILSRPTFLDDSPHGIFATRHPCRPNEIGISIVVSGLIGEVFNIAKEIDLKPHTVFLSLGIHGNKELLPDEKVLEITTMCGHGLVATKLAETTMRKVKQGRLSADEGAKLLAQPCPCGIFNTDRCQNLLELYLTTDS